MAKDALERLFEDAMKSSNGSNTSQYSLDEQLDVEDDFLDAMSNSSKDLLLSRIQKVSLDDEPETHFEDDIKNALDYSLVEEPEQQINDTQSLNDEVTFGKVELDSSDDTESSYDSHNFVTEDDKEKESSNEDTEEDVEEPEEPVVEQKRGRGRPRKKPLEETTSTPKSTESSTQKTSINNASLEDIKSLNDFMDSLAKDLINELRESNYRTHNFNKKQMNVILDYLENKI